MRVIHSDGNNSIGLQPRNSDILYLSISRLLALFLCGTSMRVIDKDGNHPSGLDLSNREIA